MSHHVESDWHRQVVYGWHSRRHVYVVVFYVKHEGNGYSFVVPKDTKIDDVKASWQGSTETSVFGQLPVERGNFWSLLKYVHELKSAQTFL